MEYRDADGLILLDEGSCRAGGRGRVYDVVGRDGIVAKILNRAHRTPQRREKVRLLREKLAGSSCKVALPLGDIWDEQGSWAGYLMPKLNGVRLDCFLRTKDVDLSFRVGIAAHFAKEVYRLHRRGISVGDLALENCQVIPETGEVFLFDADGFQLYDLDCGLFGAEEAHLKSPEMLNNGILGASVALSEKSDAFLLGSAIHEIIFLRDPFTEYIPDVPRNQVRSENVRRLRYAYALSDGALPLNMAGEALERLFHRAFSTSATPYVHEWLHALERAVEEGFVTCDCGWERPASQPACACCGNRVDCGKDEQVPLAVSESNASSGVLARVAKAIPLIVAPCLAFSFTSCLCLFPIDVFGPALLVPLILKALLCWAACGLAWSGFMRSRQGSLAAAVVLVFVFFSNPDASLVACDVTYLALADGILLSHLQDFLQSIV